MARVCTWACLNQAQPKEPNSGEEGKKGTSILACPICYQPFSLISDHSVLLSSLECNVCNKTYSSKKAYLELTRESGEKEFDDLHVPFITQFFRNRLISYIYERGWRQTFAWGGFPRPEKELGLVMDYMKPVLGGNIVDLSCGSGLFTRLFAKTGLFSLLVALDYSEHMLQQCYDFIAKEDPSFPKENVVLVRADVARLPFASGSIDAVYAGAALQCWPSPPLAMGEVSRVLRPGGIFVATTFLYDTPPIPFLPFKNYRESLTNLVGGNSFKSEGELEQLCTDSGLLHVNFIRNKNFVMISAVKPSS